jgi:integrase
MASAYLVKRRTAAGDPRWLVRYRIGGRGRVGHAGSFPAKRDADERKRFVLAQLAAGKDPADALLALATPPPAPPALRDVYTGWLATRIDVVDTGAYKTHWKRIEVVFADFDPNSFTTEQVQAWIVGQSKQLRPSTLGKTIGTLRMLLDHAGCEPNPARDPKLRMPAIIYDEPNPPSARQFVAMLERVPARWVLPFCIQERTGMRSSEIEKLTWGDVDFAEGRFRLPKRSTKTKRARWIEVPPFLMDRIADLLPLEDRSVDKRVFPEYSTGAAKVAMGRACKVAGVAHFHPYDLRHRRLSLWHLDGVPARVVAERSGHSRTSMSLDTYSHVLADRTEVADDDLVTILEG